MEPGQLKKWIYEFLWRRTERSHLFVGYRPEANMLHSFHSIWSNQIPFNSFPLCFLLLLSLLFSCPPINQSFLIKYLSSIHSIGAVGVGVPLRKWKWLVLSSLFCGASVEWNQWNVSEFSCGIDEFMNQWSKWMSGNGIDERNCGRRQSK